MDCLQGPGRKIHVAWPLLLNKFLDNVQNGTFIHHRIYDACYLNVFSKALMFRHVILRGHDLPKTQLYMLILLPWKWIDHTLGSLQRSELLLHKAINPELQGINKRRISKMLHVHICVCSSFLIYANSTFLFHGQPQLCLTNHLSWLLLRLF